MFKNYFKIAFRNVKEDKFYSFINIFGLTVGLVCSIFIFLFIRHELSYDSFNEKSEQIFRADLTVTVNGAEQVVAVAPTALLPTLEKEFPEVETGVRLFNPGAFSPYTITRDDRIFEEKRFLYADNTFFDVFTFNLIHGNRETALEQPNSVILTQETALKYFGETDPMGKTILVNNQTEYTVTGIIESVPENSHMDFDFMASFSSLRASRDLSWGNANYPTYVVLKSPTDIGRIQQETKELIKAQLGDSPRVPSFTFIPLTDIHLHSDALAEMKPQGNVMYIYIFGMVGLLIIIVACINYMNLATARSAQRAKEVGIRKTLGALKKQLWGQFFGESVIITFTSLLLSVILVNLLQPFFEQLIGQEIMFTLLSDAQLLFALGGLAIIVSFLSGAYPAFYLSGFQPSVVLKGKFQATKKGILLRKSLVVVQFSISIILIIGTATILKQLNYIQDKDLGFSTENIISLNAVPEIQQSFNAFKNRLTQDSNIQAIALASESPISINAGYGISIEGMDIDPEFSIRGLRVSPGFIETMDMNLIQGSDFTDTDIQTLEATENPRNSFIVNQSLLNAFSLTAEEAIGKEMSTGGNSGTIKGVVEDFHFSSLHENISPMVMFPEQNFNRIFVKVNTSNVQNTLTEIESVWRSFASAQPFDYTFLDAEYTALYEAELRTKNIFIIFALIAVCIACLGLFGLSSYMIERRKKEIGIRKVLGVSLSGIVTILSKDFTKLVLVSFLVAVPLSWFMMQQWLAEFAYKISIGIDVFLIAGGLIFAVTILTVSWQSVRAAHINPIDALSSE